MARRPVRNMDLIRVNVSDEDFEDIVDEFLLMEEKELEAVLSSHMQIFLIGLAVFHRIADTELWRMLLDMDKSKIKNIMDIMFFLASHVNVVATFDKLKLYEHGALDKINE